MKDQNKLGLSSTETDFLTSALRRQFEELAARSWSKEQCNSIINIAHKAGLHELERRMKSDLEFELYSILH